MSGRSLPDAERVEQIGAFFAREAPRLQTLLARRFKDPDLAQDALGAAWERLLTAPNVDPTANPNGWIYTVALNAGRDILRADRAASSLSIEAAGGELLDRVADSADTHKQLEQRERIEQLADLKPDQRHALSLLARGHSYQEIAAETGWSETKINRSLSEGRSKLRAREAGVERATEQTIADHQPNLSPAPPPSELQSRLTRMATQRERAELSLDLGIDR